jgi:hypothetical protein
MLTTDWEAAAFFKVNNQREEFLQVKCKLTAMGYELEARINYRTSRGYCTLPIMMISSAERMESSEHKHPHNKQLFP